MEANFRVGPWLVDLQSGQIVSPVGSRRIQPMLMRLLAYLADNANQVITKKRLIDDVWRGVHVTEDALTHSISELRKALGDKAKSPRIIATVPKRGYRLVAPVAIEEERGAAGKMLRYAVLPFENLSGNPGGQYFADATTDLLVTHLARIEGICVVSKTAVLTRQKTASKALVELEVDRFLEGAILQVEGRTRVNVRLLNCSDEYLWAEIYEEDSLNVLNLQNEVATSIIRRVLDEPGGAKSWEERKAGRGIRSELQKVG